jgi:hypothetical protein
MKYYNFIKELREHDLPANYQALFERIRQKTEKRVSEQRLALAGALAVLLIAVGLYFGFFRADSSASIMNYVFGYEEVNSSPIISYVFDGTF